MTDAVGRLRPRISSQAVWMAALLCVVGIATRIPFRAQILHHWDSVNFALALDHYDVSLHQPHPPGTFVIYIMLGRLFNVFLRDPNASLVWLSVVLSGLGIAVLFLLGEVLFDREVALTTGLLALVSPLIWFHGEIALSYMLEFFWVPLTLYFCYRMHTRSWGPLLASALLLGMAGGVRPNTPVFLFPVWILGIIVHRYPLKRTAVGVAVMALGVLTWAVPMVALSGGLMKYIEIMRWWQAQHTAESASLAGTMKNVIRFGMYALYSLGLGAVLLAVRGLQRLPDIVRSIGAEWRAQLLAAWVLPATGYLAIIHLRQPGHTFTIQPALLLLTGLAIVSLARRKGPLLRNVWMGLTAIVVVANALFFLAGPMYLFGDTRMLFTTPTWSAIREYDVYVTQRLEAIRREFSPGETAVVASGRNFRLPDFYLPEFQLTSLSYDINTSPVMLEDPVRTLVFLDDEALAKSNPDLTAQSVSLPNGDQLYYITWDDGEVVELSWDSLEIR